MDATELALLRLYIADPSGNNEFLHDDTLEILFGQNDSNLFATASEAWRIKAANVADWYMANIDGSFLSRNQVWEHCMAMVDHYSKISGGAGTAAGAILTNVEMDSGFQTQASESEF
jgi:hypothetical protein